MVILPFTVVVEGRVQEIRHRLWLLATAGKAGRKAIGSARCMAGLANSAVVMPAGVNIHSAGTGRCQKTFYLLVCFCVCFQKEPPFPLSPRDLSIGRKHVCKAACRAMKGLTETSIL